MPKVSNAEKIATKGRANVGSDPRQGEGRTQRTRGETAAGCCRPPCQRGFTLIELMIVVAIIAIIASIAVPNLLSARLNANEAAAIASLKTIASAQAQVQGSSIIDSNTNGTGEFGFFGELSGAVAVRDPSASGTEFVQPPVLSMAFGQVAGGQIFRSGYVFQMFLPGVAAEFVSEAPSGGATGQPVAAGLSEILWCCYAWPSQYGSSGKRAFMVNQGGDVLGTRNTNAMLSGPAAAVAGAGFIGGAGNATMLSPIAANSSDGTDRWTVVN